MQTYMARDECRYWRLCRWSRFRLSIARRRVYRQVRAVDEGRIFAAFCRPRSPVRFASEVQPSRQDRAPGQCFLASM